MIHPTAIIEEGAELGQDVSVGPFSVVMRGARLGDGVAVGPHATIFGCVKLGAGCRVHSGAVLGDLPQDLGFKGGDSFVEIGEGCTIREGVTVHRGTREGSVTRVGNHCLLMAFSHIAHNVQVGNNVVIANSALLAGYVEVADRAFISGNVGVHQFVKIGRLAMLGGNSVVNKDVPPFCMIGSGQLNAVIGLNKIGMRRSGMSLEERTEVQRAFKVLYLSGLNASQGREQLADLFTQGPAAEFAGFLEQSTRGLCPCAIHIEGLSVED
jgi:UDP-N-acetylglucosamine acyltransferase